MKTKKEILEHYQSGNRFFRNVDFDTGESYVELDLQKAVFENCYFGVDFSNSNFKNAKFYYCNLKSTNFCNCDLSNALIIDSAVDSINLSGADISNIKFENNTSFGIEVKINQETLNIEPVVDPLISDNIEYKLDPLVPELYKKVPDFERLSRHSLDDSPYNTFGELSVILAKNIIDLQEPNQFIIDSFNFFNFLGDKNNKEIDNLLVVGVYEGLYYSKKCNDLARKLLKGRNKEVYEHWMINGAIQADY